MIREYTPDDIIYIEEIAKLINPTYKFKINQYTKCLVYVENSEIIGFAMYFIMYEKAEVIDIAVKQENQRQKIGTSLLNEIMKQCAENKCESITLEVRDSNMSAIDFYRSIGFRELSIRKNYYTNGENALLMIKIL